MSCEPRRRKSPRRKTHYFHMRTVSMKLVPPSMCRRVSFLLKSRFVIS